MDKLRKIRRHLWKEHPKINKIAKFESDLVKTNEEIAPETRKIVKKNWDFCKIWMIIRSWETVHLPLPYANILP